MSTAPTVTLNNSSDTSSASAAISPLETSVTSASKLSENSNNKKEQASSNKQKFSALNINNLYKGKSLENPKTSVVVPKHGLQTVGKVSAGRRVPPPANIPSLKSSTSTSLINNTSTTSSTSNTGANLVTSGVNIVPTGGQGWAASGKDDPDSVNNNNNNNNNNKAEIPTCPSSADSVSTASSSDFLAAVPPATTKGTGSRSSSQSGPIQHSSSNERIATQPPPVRQDRRQAADSYFAQEFPQLASTTGGNSSQPQSAKDTSNVRQGSRGGGTTGPYQGYGENNHRPNQNLSYNYKDITQSGGEEDISLLATNVSSSDGQNDPSNRHSRNNSKISTSISSNPNFLLPDPPISSATSAPNSSNPLSNQQQRNNYNSNQQQQFSSQSNQYDRNSSNHNRNKQKKAEKKFMPTIISDKELKSLDHLLSEKECTWALEAEIDYTAKLDFSDSSSEDESEDQKKSISATNNSSSKPVIEPYMKPSSGLPNERSIRDSETGSFRDYPPDDSNAPKGHTVGPFRQDQNRNTYVGRKSDSVYEFNRKDSDHEGRRDYYRESHRSQQLPRGGGNMRESYSGNANTYQQGPNQQDRPALGPQSQTSSSRTSTLDRERGSGPRVEGGRKGELDENWRPKRMQDDISSAVMRGRQMREDDDDSEIVESKGKPQGPPAVTGVGTDELISSKNMPPPKNTRGPGEDMRPYDRRGPGSARDDGYGRGGGAGADRGDRDRYGPPKNQYATNLPPRLQRQAEMQYREQSQRPVGGGVRGQPIDPRYDDPRMRNSNDRGGDDLFDPRRGGDRRTPEDSSRSANVRTETGSWRNSSASHRKQDDRRDSQIEQFESLDSPLPQTTQSFEMKNPKDSEDSVSSRKTSYDSNSSKNVDISTATCDSGRKSNIDPMPVSASQQPDLNKASSVTNKVDSHEASSITTQTKEVSPTKITERSELTIEPTDQKSLEATNTSRLSESDHSQRSRPNADDSAGNRSYDQQSKRSSDRNRGGVSSNSAAYGTNNRGDGRKFSQSSQQPMLSHPENGREYHDRRNDPRNVSQQQQSSRNKDNYQRNVPPFESSSNRPALLGSGPKQSSHQQSNQSFDSSKNADVDSKAKSVDIQRLTPPQSQVATVSSTTHSSTALPASGTQSSQQQAPSVVMYPAAPTAAATNIRAVRTAYGPPSKAAFGGASEQQPTMNKQQTPPPQQQQSLQDNSKTNQELKPLLSLPAKSQQQQLNPAGRPNEPVNQRGGPQRGRADSNRQPSNQGNINKPERSDQQRDGRYRNERRSDRDRKLSTSSKNSVISNSGTGAPPNVINSQSNLNANNPKTELDDVNNDEWETASDNSDNLEASVATLDRNANVSTSVGAIGLSTGGGQPPRRNNSTKGGSNNNNNERVDGRTQKNAALYNGPPDPRAYNKVDDQRREQRGTGRRDRDRRSNNDQLNSEMNYRGGASRGGDQRNNYPGSDNYRGGVRGGGDQRSGADGANRPRTGSYRAQNTANATTIGSKGGPQVVGSRGQDTIVNAMSKVTLDDDKFASNVVAMKQQQQGPPLRKNSSNTSPFNHGGDDYIEDDYEYDDGYNQSGGGRNSGRRTRTTSNASTNKTNAATAAQPTTAKRKERSKSKGRGRGGRDGNRPAPNSNQVSQPNSKGPNDMSKPQTGSNLVGGPQSVDPKTQTKPDQRLQNSSNSGSRGLNQASRQDVSGQQPVKNADADPNKPVISQPPNVGGSSHPSTSSTKSNSFDQHDSGIESGDQPPSTSSTSTSQRSSPSNDDNKVVTSTASNTSKLTTTTNSSSVKCATATSTTDSKGKQTKSDSLNINKISEMDSSTNINNRKIVGTLIYENTKLKEENKVLTKIDESGDSSVLAKPAVPHPSSSVAEELNLKFASVKKVWDNPPPSSTNDANTERKNSLLNSLNNPADKSKSSAPIGVCQQQQIASGQPITTPPPMLATAAAYQQAVGQYAGQNGGPAPGNFHPNVVQTPTSPPTALPPNMYSANHMAPNQAGVAGVPFPFGQMEPQMNPFAANAHQNPIHPAVIPHPFMPVQPGGGAQQNAFGQTIINPAAAAMLAAGQHPNQASLFMAQLAQAHQAAQVQSQQQHAVDHMTKFNLNQQNANMAMANNLIKSQQAFVAGPAAQQASGGHHQAANAAALHAQQQGTANWAAAAAQGQQPPHAYTNLAHFVQAVGASGQPGQQPQQTQQFNRQQTAAMTRNQLDQSQAAQVAAAQAQAAQSQQQAALRSFFMNPEVAMQNQLNSQHAASAAFMQHQAHNQHHGHHHHDPTRQQQHAAALQQQQSSRQAQVAGQAAAFHQNAMNHSWPNPMAQNQFLFKIQNNPRQLMQMFAASGNNGQPISAIGPNVPMGVSGGNVTNNHNRTSPSGSVSMGGGNSFPAPIQRPNNTGQSQSKGGNNSNQYNNQSNRNGTGGNKSFGQSKGGNRNYYNHNNRNSSTPSPSGKSASISSDLNGANVVVPPTTNNTAPATVDCGAPVNKD